MAEIKKLNPNEANPTLNKAIWALIFIVFAVALWANYHFAALSQSIRLIAWVVLGIGLIALFLLTTQGKRFATFAKAARNEMRKVVWPTRQETMQSTIAVAALVVILSLLLWAIDSFWMWLITLITG